jgi:hypothetical protein
MKNFELIGYTFEASIHCVPCTFKKFPNGEGTDREGNDIHPIFAGDEFGPNECVSCDDCGYTIHDAECADCARSYGPWSTCKCMPLADIETLAENALNSAIKEIQDELKVDDGGFAGIYFSGEKWDTLRKELELYIQAELKQARR